MFLVVVVFLVELGPEQGQDEVSQEDLLGECEEGVRGSRQPPKVLIYSIYERASGPIPNMAQSQIPAVQRSSYQTSSQSQFSKPDNQVRRTITPPAGSSMDGYDNRLEAVNPFEGSCRFSRTVKYANAFSEHGIYLNSRLCSGAVLRRFAITISSPRMERINHLKIVRSLLYPSRHFVQNLYIKVSKAFGNQTYATSYIAIYSDSPKIVRIMENSISQKRNSHDTGKLRK